MIDSDDVGNGFLYGGLIVGLVFLAFYLYSSKPIIDECTANGGIMVKSDGKGVCIDKSVIIKKKDEK